jgi:hypothetical protein
MAARAGVVWRRWWPETERHMFEIAPHHQLAITRLFAAMVPLALALLFLERWSVRRRRHLLAHAALAGVLCAAASAAFWSRRGAGTGIQTAWGWPRVVYSRWESTETTERLQGIRWQGLAENALCYGTVAALVSCLLAGGRGARQPSTSPASSPDHDRLA